MKILGSQLTPRQRDEVLRAFVHRWTFENAHQTYRGRCPACVQSGMSDEWHTQHIPLMSDADWLVRHAFRFVKDGSRLSVRHRYAEPDYVD